mgnify:CR=1 FL=1
MPGSGSNHLCKRGWRIYKRHKVNVQRNAAAEAFNAAVDAYDENALRQAGLAVEKTEFYCPGLTGPFYYVTVKNSSGKILASVVTGGE